MADEIKELEKSLKTKQLIIGTKRTLKNLKLKKAETVYLARNCPTKIKEAIKKFGVDAKIVELEQSNEELGTLCKKPFFISVLSISKKG